MNFNEWWDKYVSEGREDLSQWEKDIALAAWNAATEVANDRCDEMRDADARDRERHG